MWLFGKRIPDNSIREYPSEPRMFEKVEKKMSGVNEERGVGKEVGEMIGAGQDR